MLAGYNSSTGRYIVADPLAYRVVPREITASQVSQFTSSWGNNHVVTR